MVLTSCVLAVPTAKFDPAELAQVNAKVVQELPFATVAERLEAAAVGGGEPFWMAVRDNLLDVGEAGDWWRIYTQPITPIIDSAAVTDAAADLLPEGDVEASIWQD